MSRIVDRVTVQDFPAELAGERVGVFFRYEDEQCDREFAGLITATVGPDGASYGYSNVEYDSSDRLDTLSLKGDIAGFTAVHGLVVATEYGKFFEWGTSVYESIRSGLQDASAEWAVGRTDIAKTVAAGFEAIKGEDLYPGFYYLFNKLISSEDLRRRWKLPYTPNWAAQEEMFLVDPTMRRITEERLESLRVIQSANAKISEAQEKVRKVIEEASEVAAKQTTVMQNTFTDGVHLAVGGWYNRRTEYLPKASLPSSVSSDTQASERLSSDIMDLQRLNQEEKKLAA